MKPTCPICRSPLPTGVREEFCPVCLLSDATGTEIEPEILPRTIRYVGNYELLDEIARGGMGVVFRARQKNLGRMVAVKLMLGGHFAGDEARERFRAEAAAAARLRHPNIVAIHETGDHEGQPYFSMDYIDGSTLGELVRIQPLPAMRAATYLQKVADAIEFAHQQGVLHRDLKPSNVLIDPLDQPQITDFGLAKQFDARAATESLTPSGAILGSPAYASPEQARGQRAAVGPASDVYSLGALLYHLVCGRPPFQADSIQGILRQVEDADPIPPHRLNPSIPTDLETIALKCLEKDPGRRYATARELSEDLSRFLRGEPVLARPIGPAGRLLRWARRHPGVAALSTALVLSLLAIAIGSSAAAVRIRQAERRATASLRDALVDQAQARRLTAQLGQRREGFRLLRQATALGGAAEFRLKARNELLATLGLTEMDFQPQAQLICPTDPALSAFSPQLQIFAAVRDRTNVILSRVSDGLETTRLSSPDEPITRLGGFSQDGKFLVLRHAEGISCWDIASTRLLFRTNHGARAFAFMPGGQLMALESGTNEISLLSLSSLEEVSRLRIARTPTVGRPFGWRALAASPNGQWLAASRADSNIVELVDTATGQSRVSMEHGSPVTAIEWNPTGTRLATATGDGRTFRWLVPEGRRLFNFPPLPSPARALSHSPDESLLAAACEDRVIRVRETSSMRIVFEARADSQRLFFTTNGSILAGAIRGESVGWFGLARPTEERLVLQGSTTSDVLSVALSPDSRVLSAGPLPHLRLSDAGTGQGRGAILNNRWHHSAFDPVSGDYFTASSAGLWRRSCSWTNDQTMVLGKDVLLLPGSGWRAFAFSRDGSRFAAAQMQVGKAMVFDRTFTNLLATVHHPGVDYVTLSPDGRWLATGSSSDRHVHVWSVDTQKADLKLAAGNRARASFSPDGRWMAAFGDTVDIRETGTWAPVQLPFPDIRPQMSSAAFSGDGRMLAVVSDLTDVHLFDLKRMEYLGLLPTQGIRELFTLAFSPDGTRLVAGASAARVRIWDLSAIRSRLAEFGLDWDLPPLRRPAPPVTTFVLPSE